MERKEHAKGIDIKVSKVMPIERVWLTQKDAAEYLGVSTDYIKELRLSGQISFYQPQGKLVFLKKKDIDHWIERSRVT